MLNYLTYLLTYNFNKGNYTAQLKLTGSIPDPAGLAQSNPVLGFCGCVMQGPEAVDESIMNVCDEQRRQLGAQRPAEISGSQPADVARTTHEEARVVVYQLDHVVTDARLAAVGASRTCPHANQLALFMQCRTLARYMKHLLLCSQLTIIKKTSCTIIIVIIILIQCLNIVKLSKKRAGISGKVERTAVRTASLAITQCCYQRLKSRGQGLGQALVV